MAVQLLTGTIVEKGDNMAPPLPSGPYKARAVGCGGAMDSSFVFGAICHHIKKIENCGALALGGRQLLKTTDNQPTVGIHGGRNIGEEVRWSGSV